MKKMRKKTIAILLAVAMMLTVFPGVGIQTVKAEGQPKEIDELYTIKGVKYYNTHTEHFADNSYQYLRELMGNESSELALNGYNRCMSELWLQIAGGLMVGREPAEEHYIHVGIEMAASQRPVNSIRVGDKSVDIRRYGAVPNNYSNYPYNRSTYMMSPKKAEEYVYKAAGLGNPSTTGYFKDSGEALPTVVAAIKGSLGGKARVAAVYFTNFKVVALFPENNNDYYVTTETEPNTTYGNTVASSIRNNTGSTANGTHTISNKYTASMESSVSGSETYTYQEGITIGNEFSPGLFNKLQVQVNISASQAFEKGWSKSEAITKEDGFDQSISVELPPYTNVMMKQKTTDAQAVTRYNCPVGVTFDATIVIYDENGLHKINNKPEVFKFYSTARKTLGTRYKEWKGESDWDDDEGIRWSFVTSYDNSGCHVADAIEKASTYVPVAPTGAEFIQKVKLVSAEVDGLMPILPLAKIKADPMSIDMTLGDTKYTQDFSLSGYNKKNAPYYGFSKEEGSWEVVDENGDEWTGDDVPVKISRASVSGYQTVKAVNPGVCYLKYKINENVYSTVADPTDFTSNSDLDSTAVIKVKVADDRTIEAGGSFEGYVDEAPEALDADGKLYAAVYNGKGKEIDANITWDQKESKGIKVEGNKVSFTKAGTYHVRALCESMGLESDWVTITAVKKHILKKVNAVKATCEKEGKAAHYVCEDCGKLFSDAGAKNSISSKDLVLPATGHKWDGGNVTKQPTTGAAGQKTYECTVCGKTKTEVIPALSEKKDKDTSPTAKAQEKAILSRKNDKDLPGSTYRLLQARMKKAKATSATLTWRKVPGAEKYVLYWSKCGSGNKFKKLKTVKKTSFVQKKLKKGKYYKFIIVAIKGDKALATSKIVHIATSGGKVGNHKAVKLKKKTISLKKGSKEKIKATLVLANKNLKVNKHRGIGYESGSKSIATVTKDGVVKGISPGTCYVYVYAQNGIMARITVKVQ